LKKTRSLLMGLALVAFLTTPALALDLDLSGFINVRGISDNFAASNNYIGVLEDDVKTESLIDQRLRLKMDALVNDYLSFVYYAEVDMQWGDNSYSGTPGRNDGGRIGGDTTNIETKNVYFDVKVPSSNSAFRVGLQGFDDHYDYAFFGADMAGIKYTGSLGDVDLTAGWFKLVEDNFDTTDDVDLWAIQTAYEVSPKFNLGADYYYYRNQGSRDYATFFGTTDIAAVIGEDTWTANRENMDLHYIGGHAEYHFNNMVLSGWLNVNVGDVDSINNDLSNSILTDDLDVQGYAARLTLTTSLGGVDWKLGGTYFSGDDDLTDGDANFIINPLATESFAFATDGFMIFTPDIAWNSVGQYGFAMVDSAWAGYGLGSVILTADYTPESMKKLYIKAGVGYFSSLEDELAADDPRTDRAGKELGTEVFLRAGYKFADNLDLSVNGAYASLGDFYDNHGGGLAANDVTTDIDDPYEVYVKATLTF